MSKLSKKMQELKRVIRLHANWLVYATLGESALSKSEIEELEKYGKLPMDRTLDLADKSYLLGRLRAILKRSEYKDISYEEAEEKLYTMKLSPIEELVLEQARLKAGQALKGLAQEISDGVYDALAQALGTAVTEAAVRQVVADETQLAIIYKKTAQDLASTLAARLQTSAKRDWKMVAQTELQRAKVAGQAQAIVNKVDIYAHSDGPDSKVSVIPAANCCEDCREHYLDASGNPKVFTLSDLIAAGSNGDPGVIHKKKNGVHTHWKTTLPPLHPNCGCNLVYVPSGYGWTAGKLGLLNKSLFDMTLRKANSTAGVSGGITPTVAPKGPPQPKPTTASAGTPSVAGVAAPGNVAGPGKPPGSGATTAGGSTQQMSPCPFGGGTECVSHGGNGATEHKANGSVMKKHQEAMARGAQPTTELAKEQQKQQFEAQAEHYNNQENPRQKTLEHLSSGEIGSVKVLGDDDHKGVSDSYKVTIVGNGSGCLKPAFKFGDYTYNGLAPSDGGPSMPKQSSHLSEAGAYQLATSLGMDHVPVTTTRHHDGSKGIEHTGQVSVQHWQDDYGHISDIAPNAKGLSFIPPEHKETVVNKLKEIACLDIVMNNNDRHSGNLVFKDDLSDVKAIDHGLSFAAGMAGHKNGIHGTLHRHTENGLQVPDHLMTKFKNQSMEQTLRSLDGLTTWQKVQTHVRMKYLAHLQETHGKIPIEVTRFAGVHAQSYDPDHEAIPHDQYSKFGRVPYRVPGGQAGWEQGEDERNAQIKSAMENWEMPDQLFARFVKSYANGELGEISDDERLMLNSVKPAFKTGTGHELAASGVAPEHKEAHQKYWDSIPAYKPMNHWESNTKATEPPLRTAPTMEAPKTAAKTPKAKKATELSEVPKTVARTPKAIKKSLYIALPSARFPLT